MKIRTLILAALAATAFAQEHRTAPYSEIKTYLNLTDAQVQQIQQAREKVFESTQALAEQMRAKQQALRDMLSAGTTDAAAVGRAVLEVEALRKQLEQVRTTAGTAALAVLAADQKAKLKTLEDAAALQDEIRGATMLGLISPPEPGPGIGIRHIAPGMPAGVRMRHMAPGMPAGVGMRHSPALGERR